MTLLQNVTQYLEDNGVGTQGTDIFRNDMPPKTTNCVMVRLTGGLEPNKYVAIKALTFQVWVRNSNPDTAVTKSYEIYDLLHQKYDDLVLESGGVDVMKCDASSEPQFFSVDEEGRTIYSTTYLVHIR